MSECNVPKEWIQNKNYINVGYLFNFFDFFFPFTHLDILILTWWEFLGIKTNDFKYIIKIDKILIIIT